MSDSATEAVNRLLNSFAQAEQLELREKIRGDRYYKRILKIYLNNPFFKLTPEEVEHFKSAANLPINQLILARDQASKSTTPKLAVFCMPKSGSSFVQSALKTALQMPLMSLTSAANPRASSFFGMNSREQELDELAIVKSALAAPGGYVAQAHTRCSLYLSLQLRFYRIWPILTIRNILDCIVSFDDMMIAWRDTDGRYNWVNDTQFALPLNYPDLDERTRYTILARSFGIWLIAFYLSWKRCMDKKYVRPLILKYEEDILDPSTLVGKMTSRIKMSDEQIERLDQYVSSPNREMSRLNKGVKGRGARIDSEIADFLTDYARQFGDELTDDEIRYLIR